MSVALKHLQQQLKSFTGTDTEFIADPTHFEYISAVYLSEKFKKEIVHWSKAPIQLKKSVSRFSIDTGIDLISLDGTLVFQVKNRGRFGNRGTVDSGEILKTTTWVENSREDFGAQCPIENIYFLVSEYTSIPEKSRSVRTEYEVLVMTDQEAQAQLAHAREILYVPQDETLEVADLKPLYDYQSEVVEWALKHHEFRVQMPCGSGKTRVMLEIINRYRVDNPHAQVCILVPSISLAEQWMTQLDTYKYQFKCRWTGAPARTGNIDLVVMNSSKHCELKYDLIVVDEGHKIINEWLSEAKKKKISNSRSPIGSSYTLCQNSLRVGYFSATFESPKRMKSINVPVSRCIEEGRILDFFIHAVIFSPGDYFRAYAEQLLAPKFLGLNAIMAFGRDCEQVKVFYEICLEFGIKTGYILGNETSDKSRQDVLEQFQNGEIRVLVSCDTIGLGVNIPRCDASLFLDNRYSNIVITQYASRCCRTYPGKFFGTVIIPGVDNNGLIDIPMFTRLVEQFPNNPSVQEIQTVRKNGGRSHYFEIANGKESSSLEQNNAQVLYTSFYDKDRNQLMDGILDMYRKIKESVDTHGVLPEGDTEEALACTEIRKRYVKYMLPDKVIPGDPVEFKSSLGITPSIIKMFEGIENWYWKKSTGNQCWQSVIFNILLMVADPYGGFLKKDYEHRAWQFAFVNNSKTWKVCNGKLTDTALSGSMSTCISSPKQKKHPSLYWNHLVGFDDQGFYLPERADASPAIRVVLENMKLGLTDEDFVGWTGIEIRWNKTHHQFCILYDDNTKSEYFNPLTAAEYYYY